jgi:hypothetical protein
MSLDEKLTYFEFQIDIVEEAARFKAHVTREGGLVAHDGRSSEVWVTASCNSRERAIWVAKNAIDTDRVR